MAEKKVMTVCGPVAPEKIGFTTMHEHIMFQGSVLARRLRKGVPESCKLPVQEEDKVSLENVGLLLKNSIMAWDALIQDDEAVMTGEVQDFKDTGGDTIVEVSVPGIQLETEPMKRISENTGVHVVVSTGFYTWDSWPEEFLDKPLKFYRDHMLHEVKHGVQGTDYKPGMLKIAVQDLNEMEENALRAAAQVSNETGLPLTIHPCYKPGGDRVRLIKILQEEGMDLEKVVMAHTSLEDKPASFRELIYHPELYKVTTQSARRILDLGVNCSVEFCNPLGFEMMGRYRTGDYGQMAGLYELINSGYCDQLVLGNDVCGRTMLRRFGALGYLRLTTFVIPTLREQAGVSEYAIRAMTEKNPARILAY
ncbi:phosphotriesterase [Christensenellaceae bacterium OttesenSCG-928-M15]|nr:phosphotriesterase [Christensenellaceae bacterium OttesenSCG-928-M15]